MLFRRTMFAAIAALTCLCLANDAMAQPGGGWGGGSRLQYLNDPTVQKELEILEDQLADIEDVGSEARDIMRDAFSGMREKFSGISREERDELMTEIREKMQEKMKVVDEKVGSILVPHQLERLDQIVLQSQMRSGGTAAALQSDTLREKLGLTEKEAEALKKKEEEVNQKLAEDIKKLREKARDDIFSVLPAEKQKSIKELIGDTYDMPENRGRGGARGGRGGGDRGGRGGGDRGGRGGGDRGGRGGRGGDTRS